MSRHADPALREATFTGPLVGRQAELRVAHMILDRASSGRGQVLGLVGAAGIGKSRLVAEIHRLARRRSFEVVAGACAAHGTADAYLVWHPIWRALFEIDPSLPVAEQQARLTARIFERDGGSSQRASLLGPVVNLALPDSELTASLDPQTRAALLQTLLLDHLRDAAAATPLLIILEDGHWMDPASRVLFEFLARNIAEERLLLLVTSRPPEAGGPAFGSVTRLGHFTELLVPELPQPEAERLVAERIRLLTGGDRASSDAVQQIAAWAGGNPFHLEELVLFVLATDTGPLGDDAVANLRLPGDLRQLVAARADQLDRSEQVVLEVASVLGSPFPASWVWGSYPAAGPAEQVLRQLTHLTELQLLRRLGPSGEPEFAFRHVLTQDAIYTRLSRRRRELLHERVARFIERTYADRLSQFVDVLAHHYRMTSNLPKQRTWFRVAGTASRKAFATEAAIAYFEELRELLPSEERGDLLIELGDLLSLAARWIEAEAAFQEALEVARATNDPKVEAQAIRGLGSVLPYVLRDGRTLNRAAQRLRDAVMRFDQLKDRSGLAKTLDRLAWTLWGLGDYDGALEASHRQLALATEADDHVGRSTALENMGVVHWLTGDHAGALPLLEQALEAAKRAGYRPGIIVAANDLASVHSDLGDQVAAIEGFNEALSVAEAIGDRRMAALAIGNIGEPHRRRGEYGLALRCFSHAFHLSAEIGDPVNMVIVAGNLATTLAAQGREREAGQLLGRAIELARHLDSPFWLSDSLYHWARLLAVTGRADLAETANTEALEIATSYRHRGVLLPARLLSLRLRVDRGDLDRSSAIRELRELRDTWTEPSEEAAILDAIWQLDPAQEQARREAARRYQELYERTLTMEYREAYERLVGTALPSRQSPLPPIPASVTRPLDLAWVLARLEQAIGKAEPATTPAS
jgi:tetratricopeptide (TPR) repeat protein